jgi:RNA polymerase sigma factor (TIGR02999 family)
VTNNDQTRVTELLKASRDAPGGRSAQDLIACVYDELRSLARGYFRKERAGHTLQPTALVHEAYLRLVGRSNVEYQDRTHFYAVCARAMRQILIDHARGQKRLRRGGDRTLVSLNECLDAAQTFHTTDVEALNDALEKLESLDPRQAKVVELRFLGGLSISEIADYLNVSKRTVEGDWTHARAWLSAELSRTTHE